MTDTMQTGRVYNVYSDGAIYKGVYLLDVAKCGTVTNRSSFLKSDAPGKLGFTRDGTDAHGLKHFHVFIPLDNIGVKKLFASNHITSTDKMLQLLGDTLKTVESEGALSSPFKSHLNTLDLVTHGVDMIQESKVIVNDAVGFEQSGLSNNIDYSTFHQYYFRYLVKYCSILENWLKSRRVLSDIERQKILRQMLIIYSIVPCNSNNSPIGRGGVRHRCEVIQKWLKTQ